jgi:hypothetical protein
LEHSILVVTSTGSTVKCSTKSFSFILYFFVDVVIATATTWEATKVVVLRRRKVII